MNKHNSFLSRKRRVRAKVKGDSKRPRLVVFKSNRYIYAQIIDDSKGVTLASISSVKYEGKEKGAVLAETMGKKLAEIAKEKKIKSVVFDKSGYKYHGRIKSFADAARKGDLIF